MARLTIDELLNTRIIAIIRGVKEEQILDVTEALVNGGIKALEITVESKRAYKTLEKAAGFLNGKAIVGAGTVLDSESARMAIASGAEFLISPNLSIGMIETANRHGKIAIPGVLTPTEIVDAVQAGAAAVKIFPAGSMGPKYIKELKGPLAHVRMVATGGISIDNAKDFISFGADGLGIGGSLVNKELINQGNYQEITRITKQFFDLLK